MLEFVLRAAWRFSLIGHEFYWLRIFASFQYSTQVEQRLIANQIYVRKNRARGQFFLVLELIVPCPAFSGLACPGFWFTVFAFFAFISRREEGCLMTSSDKTDKLQDEHALDSALSNHKIREKLDRSLRAAKDGKLVSQTEMERCYLDDMGRKLLLDPDIRRNVYHLCSES